MNLNNLYMSLLVVLFSTNITADDNHSHFNCYSTDPELGDSAFWAGEAIELFSQNKYAESPSFSLFEKHAGFAIIFDE